MSDSINILHLEDVLTDVALVERVLKKSALNFNIKHVDNKEDYVTQLFNYTPDIVISDHSLPSFNSIEALKILKDSAISIPFILVTATVSEDFAVLVMKNGASDYLLKDRLERLPVAVMNALANFRFEDERQQFLKETLSKEKLVTEAEKLARFGTWKFDLLTGITQWSEGTFKILGYNAFEVAPSEENFLRNILPDEVVYVKTVLRDAPLHTGHISFDFRVKEKTGNIKHIRSTFLVERNQDGEPVCYTGFNQDVSEAKNAELLLQKSEANMRTILENADSAYVLVNRDLIVEAFNKKGADFSSTHYNVKMEIGTHAYSYFPDERLPVVKEVMAKALQGELVTYQLQTQPIDGESRWYDIKWSPIRGQTGEVSGIILSFNNITKEKLFELERDRITADLVQRNKSLEQFAYIISHNLRAPVANILGFSSLLSSDGGQADWSSDVLDGLALSAKTLDNVIMDLNQILEVKNHVKEQAEPVNFTNLVQSITESLTHLIKSEHVKLTCNFEAINTLFTLKSYLHSIFYNLILNSIKFRRAGIAPEISIESEISGTELKLIFSDNGQGMDLKKGAKEVFGLYKRFHTSVEGKGMGLFMVKTQVETLGGSVSVESEVNQGTQFTILFNL